MDEGRDDTTGGPVVVGANWYRFRAGEHIRHELVVTLCFVWVVHGSGTIRTGGHEFQLTPGSMLRLPWRHSVEYLADERTPFSVGTIHVIPWHSNAVPVIPRPAFYAGDPLLRADFRRGGLDHSGDVRGGDVRGGDVRGGADHGEADQGGDERGGAVLLPARSAVARNIAAIGTYAIDRMSSGAFTEPSFRAIGVLAMEESAAAGAVEEATTNIPPLLQRMIDFIEINLASPLSVSGVAQAAGCSTVTAERLFTRHTGMSVLAWQRTQRMQRAALLLRESGLRVSEVAGMVGFTDPLYFSRVFRKTFAIPPSRYAAGELRP